MNLPSPRTRFLALCAALGVLGAAATAAATPQVFTIDPTQSWLSVAGSELLLDLGPGAGTVSLAAAPQAGNVGGVAGSALPDGTTGDGLRTTVGGQLLVDRQPGTIEFRTQLTQIVPSVSGLWLPGAPGLESTPQSAQLGILLSDAGLGLDVLAAVRSAAFTYFSAALPLVASGPGALAFDAGQSFRLETGTFDFDSNVGLAGRSFLPPLVGASVAGGGLLEDLGGTLERLTVPIDVTLVLGPELLDGLPITANLHVGGQIVATVGEAPVPEPGVALLLLGAGALALLLRGAHGRRSPGLLVALLTFGLSAACNPPANGRPPPEVCDNAVDDDRDGASDCGDSECGEAAVCGFLGECGLFGDCLDNPDACNDALDNEDDGLVDCDDPECNGIPVCQEQVCNDGIDDEGDGLVDCEDADCFDDSFCREQVCDDRIDDDQDGQFDCVDADCFDGPACDPGEICDDGIDNEGDGRIDALDPECVDGPAPIVSLDCDPPVSLTAFGFGQNVPTSSCGGAAQVQSGGNRTTISVRDVPAAEEATTGEHEVAVVVSHERDSSEFGAGFGNAAFELVYGPGGDRLLVGVRLLLVGNAGSATPPTATVDCAGTGVFGVPVNAAAPVEIPADPSGGSCLVVLGYGCDAGEPGVGACELSFYAVDPSDVCTTDAGCDANERCGPGGVCQDGTDLDPCDSPYDCDANGGYGCTFGGVCTDGSAGDPCNEALGDIECGPGLSCDFGICQ